MGTLFKISHEAYKLTKIAKSFYRTHASSVMQDDLILLTSEEKRK